MGKSYRIKTDLGVDKNISFQLEQDFEFLEILSLQISQNDVYTRNCADYGVVVGRVIANGGLGIPNVKVSIFVPITETDALNEQIVALYPYVQPNDRDTNGIRFNLLPSEPSYAKHAVVGTFPTREEVLKDPTLVAVYDRYYKYTVKTNESGDYMIFGVPLGQQTMVMDLDLSDIGEFSLTPQDLIRMGRATEAQVAGDRFQTSTNLESLPQIVSITKTFEVNPFWGDPSLCQAEVNRVDFDLREETNIDIEPTAIFMGSMFSSPDEYRIGAPSVRTDGPPSVLGRGCKPKDNTGSLCQNIPGPGQVLAVRQTINQDDEGRPILEEYRLENSGNVIDGDGTWVVEVPMNLDYVTTSEDGTRIFSRDPSVGIPTKGKYRFKIKWQQSPNSVEQIRRPYYLVPNIREYGWQLSSVDPIYGSNPLLLKDLKSSYYFGIDWSGYTDASTTAIENEKLNNAINCLDTFYEFQYNKVFTVSSLIDQYKRGGGRSKFIGVKDIADNQCTNTTNNFPVNEGVKNFDLIYFLFSILFQIFQITFVPLLITYHIIAFLWNNLAVPIVIALIGISSYLAYTFFTLTAALMAVFGAGLLFLAPAIFFTALAITLTTQFRRITKFKFGPFNLSMLTYPECQGCDCKPGDTIAGDSEGGGTSLLTPLANPGLYYEKISESDLKFNKVESGDDKGSISDDNIAVQSFTLSQAVGSRIFRNQKLGVYKSTESEETRLPDADNDKYFAYGTSLPMAQRVNQFNSRKKYFDGLNRISVSFDNPSNATTKHFDNTLTIMSQSQFPSGTLLTFVNPENSSDNNYKFSSNTQSDTGISGTTLFIGPSTVTINYATSQTTDTTKTYTLSSGSTETNYNYPADIEYYQVVTAITVSDAFNLIAQPGCSSCRKYVVKCDDSTVGQLFAYFSYQACDGTTQYVNLTNVYDTTAQDWVGETMEVCACATPTLDSGDGSVVFVGPVCQLQPTYNSFLKLINSVVNVTYNRKKGLSWGKPDTTGYQPRTTFEGFENQYILILQRGVDPYSPLYTNKYGIGKILGFTNEDDVVVTTKSRVNVPIQKLTETDMSVQNHNVQSNIFYESKFFRAGNGFSAFTTSNVGYYSGLDANTEWKNFVNSGGRTLKSYGVNDYFDYPTNNSVVLTTSIEKNDFFDSQVNDGKYDSLEDVSGLDFYWLKTSGQGKKPSQVDSEYISVSLLPQFESTPLTISNKILNVMRTDRLPSSDFLEGSNWNGIVPVLQQNLGFTIYEITTQYQEDFTTVAYGTGADIVTSDITDLTGAVNVLETFSCTNMVSIDCYSGDGKTFGVKADCQNNDIVYDGCYRFMTKPLVSLPKDLLGFTEYGVRYRFFYALCRGVLSQTFTNNWVNGTLYTPPIQTRTVYDGQNKPVRTTYCKEFVYFNDDSNNFYMRSSPYNPSSAKGFIGKRQTPSAGKINDLNLLYPTTIMNLGPKSDIYSEISLDPTYKGFVMNKLTPTSYGDTSDILTFFVISRITNNAFIRLLSLTTLPQTLNSSIINILFSRKEFRADGDLVQLLSINSENGVIKFSADAYESFGGTDDPVQLLGNDISGPVMGIFFSSTTEDLQFKDFLTPGKINFRPNPASSAIQYSYGIKSQEVPFYQWEQNPPRSSFLSYLFPRLVNQTIFGSDENTWATETNDIFSRKYQVLDRTNVSSPTYFIGSNTQGDDRRARGYIYMQDNNGVITPNVGKWNNKFLVGAPFHFYFGLKTGLTALDKFKQKYLSDE
jgi:hypothetical protein